MLAVEGESWVLPWPEHSAEQHHPFCIHWLSVLGIGLEGWEGQVRAAQAAGPVPWRVTWLSIGISLQSQASQAVLILAGRAFPTQSFSTLSANMG